MSTILIVAVVALSIGIGFGNYVGVHAGAWLAH